MTPRKPNTHFKSNRAGAKISNIVAPSRAIGSALNNTVAETEVKPENHSREILYINANGNHALADVSTLEAANQEVHVEYSNQHSLSVLVSDEFVSQAVNEIADEVSTNDTQHEPDDLSNVIQTNALVGTQQQSEQELEPSTDVQNVPMPNADEIDSKLDSCIVEIVNCVKTQNNNHFELTICLLGYLYAGGLEASGLKYWSQFIKKHLKGLDVKNSSFHLARYIAEFSKNKKLMLTEDEMPRLNYVCRLKEKLREPVWDRAVQLSAYPQARPSVEELKAALKELNKDSKVITTLEEPKTENNVLVEDQVIVDDAIISSSLDLVPNTEVGDKPEMTSAIETVISPAHDLVEALDDSANTLDASMSTSNAIVQLTQKYAAFVFANVCKTFDSEEVILSFVDEVTARKAAIHDDKFGLSNQLKTLLDCLEKLATEYFDQTPQTNN